MDRPRPFTKEYKRAILKRRCIILGVFLFTLFALNYIFSPYKYIGKSLNGLEITIDYRYLFMDMSLYTKTTSDIGIHYYIKGEKINSYDINDKKDILTSLSKKEDFYAITEAEPNKKIYFTKKKDLLYFFKKAKGPLFTGEPRV